MMLLNTSISDMVDIHCHAVPYVDDGAEDFDEAKEIIREAYRQGVRVMVMTVHLEDGCFDTPIEKVQKQFDELNKWITRSSTLDMEIYLSREYYCDKRFETILDGYIHNMDEVIYGGKSYRPKEEILPFGENNCILLELSSNRIQDEEIEIFVKKASRAGLTPIIAHVERCPIVQERPTIVYKMQDYGAYIQVNCDALLSKTEKKECETAQILVQKGMADLVSSDSHNMEDRSPDLKKCYSFLKKKYGKNTADRLLRDNALSLIYDKQ